MGKENTWEEFFGDGFFHWQLCTEDQQRCWDERHYDEGRYWGGFSREPFDKDNWNLPGWAIGPFRKFDGNPVMGPSLDGWDYGHFGGGVHNGSILKKDGGLVYVYRGEFPCEPVSVGQGQWIDYRCDIGIAYSKDGRHFIKDVSRGALFGSKESGRFSYEDVNLVTFQGKYYLFCNRWEWEGLRDPSRSGAFLAVSDDLAEWTQVGLLFPAAARIHRNPCVLQNPDNKAVRIGGRFVMYLNDGLIAFSENLIQWTSEQVDNPWPGGEGCFALTDHRPGHPDDIILFTGGHHTGHFYAIGEVLMDKSHPKNPVEWLPRPILSADPDIPHESGLSSSPPHIPVSHWRDTVFFTGMTRFRDEWLVCYGGSEYYTCVASASSAPDPDMDGGRFLPLVTTWEEWCRIYTDVMLWEPAIREICRMEGISVTSVNPGFPGSNAVFLLDDKMVIKISPPQYHGDHRNELEVGRVLGSRVPIPKVLASGVFHDRIDWPWFIMEYRPGMAVREIRNRIDRENWFEICREAGAITFEIHGTALSELKCVDTTREGWTTFVENRRTDAINELIDAGVPNTSVFDEIKSLLADFPFPESPLVLVNADLTEDHLLLVEHNGKWQISALIDLADSQTATVPYEWPALWFGLLGQDKESLLAFLGAYNPELRVDADFRHTLFAYTLLHRFCWRGIRDILIKQGPIPVFSLGALLGILFWKEEESDG